MALAGRKRRTNELTPLLEWSLALPDAPELLEAEDHSKAGVFCSQVAIMTAGNGKPCVRCGTSEWYKDGSCRECGREQARRWQQANRDKRREISRQWASDNREKSHESNRRYRQANPDKVAEKNSRWQRTNPDRVNAITNRHRTRKTEAGGSYTAAEWKALCDHHGNKCLRCGRKNVKLTADHVNPVAKGGHSDIENIQPLCRPCNSSKGDKNIDYRPDAGPLRWLQAKLFG